MARSLGLCRTTGAPFSTVTAPPTPHTQVGVTTWIVTIAPGLHGRCHGMTGSLMRSERCWSHRTTRGTSAPSLATTGAQTWHVQLDAIYGNVPLALTLSADNRRRVLDVVAESCWRYPSGSWRSVAGTGLATTGSSLDARRISSKAHRSLQVRASSRRNDAQALVAAPVPQVRHKARCIPAGAGAKASPRPPRKSWAPLAFGTAFLVFWRSCSLLESLRASSWTRESNARAVKL